MTSVFIRSSILRFGIFSFLWLAACESNQVNHKELADNRVRSILSLAEQNWKTFGPPKVYEGISHPDSIRKVVADESAKALYNSKMQFFMSIECLEQKRTAVNNSYVGDSTILTTFNDKSQELGQHLMSDLKLEELLITIEKIKLLTVNMDKLCPSIKKDKLVK